jgi:hypothetical protein
LRHLEGGEEDAECGAFARLAFNFNLSVVCLHDALALKHPDADSTALRGLKRAEEQALHEVV